MVRKRKKEEKVQPSVAAPVASRSPGNMLLLPQAVIFCFYCDRVFSDESTLITHQKARHFK